MPKPLTIQIPEPDQDGDCSSFCPLRHAEYDRLANPQNVTCARDLEIGGSEKPYIKPGPKCPQYKE